MRTDCSVAGLCITNLDQCCVTIQLIRLYRQSGLWVPLTDDSGATTRPEEHRSRFGDRTGSTHERSISTETDRMSKLTEMIRRKSFLTCVIRPTSPASAPCST